MEVFMIPKTLDQALQNNQERMALLMLRSSATGELLNKVMNIQSRLTLEVFEANLEVFEANIEAFDRLSTRMMSLQNDVSNINANLVYRLNAQQIKIFNNFANAFVNQLSELTANQGDLYTRLDDIEQSFKAAVATLQRKQDN